MSLFPDRFPHYALNSGIESPLRLRWVKGVCLFRCSLPPALLVGFFTCQCGNTGIKQSPNKNQHRVLTLEKKILPPFLPGFELTTFRSRVRRPINKLSRSWPTIANIPSLYHWLKHKRKADCCKGRWLVVVYGVGQSWRKKIKTNKNKKHKTSKQTNKQKTTRRRRILLQHKHCPTVYI